MGTPHRLTSESKRSIEDVKKKQQKKNNNIYLQR